MSERDPLNSPAVNELAVVTGTLNLLCEWLARYFDGNDHAVGGNDPVLFPKPELLFQLAPVTQPSDAGALADTLALSLVWNDPTRRWTAWETVDNTRQEVVQSNPSFNFWVRATGTNAGARAKLTADRLRAVLDNSAETRVLGQKGILRVRAREPRVIQSGDYALYHVLATVQLRYFKLSQLP